MSEAEKMVTDKDRLLGLLGDFGITPSGREFAGNSVVLEEGCGNVTGYYDFFCAFEFDQDGKFIKVGVWE